MTRASALVVLAGLAGCGRIGFDAVPAADAAPPCMAFGAWSTPEPVTGIDTPADDWEPELSPDGAWLVFASDRNGGANHLYLAPHTGTAFGAATEITALASTVHDQGPAWSGDGAYLYFDSDRTGANLLYAATFDGTTFGAPAQVTSLADQSVVSPTLSADGLEIVWGDTFDATTSLLDFVERASPTGITWPDQEDVHPELDPAGWPSLGGDRLAIYFESQRAADGGHYHIYDATRPTLDGAFSAPQPFELTEPTADEGDPFISHDGRTLLFSSNRAGGSGLEDIWITTRACL